LEQEFLPVDKEALRVPNFEYLSGELFRAAVTRSPKASEIVRNLDSVVRFAATGTPRRAAWRPAA
jgi:hypothetical protein